MQIISLAHHQAAASTHTAKSYTSSTHTVGHMREVTLSHLQNFYPVYK